MSKCLSLLLVASMVAFGAQGASWVVWPGQSLQAAITNAAAGDNITIKEGNYVENITLTKGMDIRGEAGKELTTSVQGKWVIQNATAPVYLKGFKIGVSTNGNIAVTGCTDVRMDYITANPSSLVVTNSAFYMYRSSISSNVTFNGGNFTLQKSTVSGSLTSDNVDTKILASTVTGNLSHNTLAKECTVFQSTVGEKLYVSATNYWIGYNTIRYAEIRNGNGSCEVVGNRFEGRDSGAGVGVLIDATSPIVRNNLFNYSVFYQCNNMGDETYTLSLKCVVVTNASPVLQNNSILQNLLVNNIQGARCHAVHNGYGIYVTSGNPRIINSIFFCTVQSLDGGNVSGSKIAMVAGAAVEVKYNDFFGWNAPTGGCLPIYCISNDPQMDGNYVLQAGSPCINTGAPEPEFNDLDNTRNDMGLWGGHSYDPTGRTTTKPVVMATEAAPLYIKRGQNIMLKARGAVAAP